MSNLILTSTLFRDEAATSPPRQWNAALSRYEFLDTDANGLAWIESVSPVGTSDAINFEITLGGVFVSGGPTAATLTITYGAAPPTVFYLTAGETIQYMSGPLAEPAAVKIELESAVNDGSGYQLEAYVTPIADSVAPPAGGDTPQTDTYSLKGFFSFPALSVNADYIVAQLGELSVHSQTYAKDRDIYAGVAATTPSAPVSLSVFSSRRDTGQRVEPPVAYADKIVEMGEWVYQQSIAGAFTTDETAFRQQFLAEFEAYADHLVVGNMIQQGAFWMPEYVIFYLTPEAVGMTRVTGDEYLDSSRIKIWFADESFANQYDEFEIEFLAPVDNLDDVFKAPSVVKTLCESRTTEQLFQRVQVLSARNPYTQLKSQVFEYNDPNNTTVKFPTEWTFIIWGAAGNNIDAIKQRLQDWILLHSTHTREEWVAIFPDIFTSTEFIIAPLWNQYAVPNMTLDEGVYSPTVNVARGVQIGRNMFTGTRYTNYHIDLNMAMVGTPYKSLALAICGGPENRDGIARFEAKWPDYMAVTTASVDFNRMQPVTQAFVNHLYALLKVAEEMTEFSDVPLGFSRVKRVNSQGMTIMYAVASFDNTSYMVVTKESLERYFPSPQEVQELSLLPAPTEQLFTPVNSKRLQVNFEAAGGRAPYTYSISTTSPATGSIDETTGYADITFANFGEHLLDVTVVDADNRVFVGNYSVGVYGA